MDTRDPPGLVRHRIGALSVLRRSERLYVGYVELRLLVTFPLGVAATMGLWGRLQATLLLVPPSALTTWSVLSASGRPWSAAELIAVAPEVVPRLVALGVRRAS